VTRFIGAVERAAGLFLGLVAVITFAEAALRYTVAKHIPDGFIVGQMAQGIAICWGIATATYADRHITVDALYTVVGKRWQRIFDMTAYTINLVFFLLFGFMITFKVYDILRAGERSIDLNLPIWGGYLVASMGILVTVVLAAARWWQVIWKRQR
jgi:TRAP-type transport system small permease protein